MKKFTLIFDNGYGGSTRIVQRPLLYPWQLHQMWRSRTSPASFGARPDCSGRPSALPNTPHRMTAFVQVLLAIRPPLYVPLNPRLMQNGNAPFTSSERYAVLL
jgi:hypothetical protein